MTTVIDKEALCVRLTSRTLKRGERNSSKPASCSMPRRYSWFREQERNTGAEGRSFGCLVLTPSLATLLPNAAANSTRKGYGRLGELDD